MKQNCIESIYIYIIRVYEEKLNNLKKNFVMDEKKKNKNLLLYMSYSIYTCFFCTSTIYTKNLIYIKKKENINKPKGL